MASSLLRWIDQTAATVANDTPSSTRNRFFAQASMTRATMIPP
jgi:hypothetical protein